MRFEWDPKKAALNFEKHGISFSEAATVFDRTDASIFDDPDHSLIEHREIILGVSAVGRILFVSFTSRGDGTRIISARRADKKERAQYEDFQKKTGNPKGN